MMTIMDVEYSITAAVPMSAGSSGYGVGVEPPALVPTPVNLVRSSRNPTDSADTRWTNGFRYLPLSNGELAIYDDCGIHPGVKVPINKDTAALAWQPYVLSAKFTCSAMGSDLNEYAARAKGLLDAATPKLLEYELWHGSLAQTAGWTNLYFEQPSGVDVYTAASINDAIGTLEQYLAEIAYGGRGMIHCAPYLSPYLQFATRREGNLLLTNRDTIVVPGSGYGQYPAVIVPATGAIAGSPGSFTPAGCTIPPNFAAMSGSIVASPATAWTAGQYVVLGDASHAAWNGTAWAVVAGIGLLEGQGQSAVPYAPPPKPTGPYKFFATGITDVRLGDILTWPEDLNQAINRSTNTVDVRAQRYACASWDGVAFARVDLTFTP